MEYRNIQYWHLESEEEESILEAAVALSQQGRHSTLLYEIAKFICKHIEVRYLLIGQISKDCRHVYTLVFMDNFKLLDNYTYALAGTPCEVSVSQSFCYHPYDVAASYPDDKDLQVLQIESYLGYVVLSDASEPTGIITLMDVKQIQNAALAEHLIMIFSPAIEAEIKLLNM